MMELERYNPYNEGHRKRRFGKKTLIFIVFSLVLLFLLFSAFYGGEITGNIIGPIVDLNNSIEINTSLSIPDIILYGKYKEVFLSLNEGTIMKIGDQNIVLEEIENKIVLNDFDGEININEEGVKKLSGKISKIKINNLPISLQGNGKLKIYLTENSKYSFFQINKEVYLKKVFFISSGVIKVDEDLLNLNSEKVEIKNYLGSLTIKDNKLIMEGLVKSLSINGRFRNLVLSK